MSLFRLFRRSTCRRAAERIYASVVGQARQSTFYTDCGVPDTPDGRFDMILIHAFLVLHRFKEVGPPAADLGQAVFDVMFDDMDRNLREMGVGDLGVSRRIKAMAEAFYGRIGAYEEGLAGDDGRLGDALRRNLFRHGAPAEDQLAHVAAYMRREARNLAFQDRERLLAGEVSFGPPAEDAAGPGDE